MTSFNYETLEFTKILTEIAAFTKSDTAKNGVFSLKPQTNKQEIIYRQKTILEALEILVKIGNLSLISNYDIDQIINSIKIKRNLTISDIQYLRLFLVMGKNLKKQEKEFLKEKISYPNLKEYFKQIDEFTHLIELIDSIIDSDGVILDKASFDLSKIRRDLRKATTKQKELLNSLLIKKSSYLTENIIVTRNDKYCLAVRSEDKNKVKGIIQDVSASKTTTYIEPIEIYQVSSEITNLKMAEKLEIEIILNNLLETFHPYTNSFKINLEMYVKLDTYFSYANFSLKHNCNKVEITNEVELINARHPLINKEEVVPVYIKLSSEQRVLMITGPNTGGKTVALKTLGLLSTMALCGLLIPADEGSKVNLFSGIYADIGDAQSIAQSLSTFSSHMINIAKILEDAKENSLLLFDELGSGTDPKEGVSLAKAIIDYAIEKNFYLVLTTHYSELKMFAYESPYILNASVRFDEETLKPLYLIDYGRSGSSNALNIVKRLKMNEEIISKANSYLNDQKTDVSVIMERFEKRLNELDALVLEANLKEQQLEEMKANYNLKLAGIQKERERIIQETEKESNLYIKNLKERATQIIESLENIEKPHEIANIKHELNKMGFNIEDEDNDIKVGDSVYIKKYKQNGTVLSIKDNQFIVKFGDFTLPFKNNQLSKLEKPLVKNKQITKKPTREIKMITGSVELDLRGYRALDVEDAYLKFVDQALLANLKEVRIIHGFGTGTVRKIIHDLLKKDNNVKSYRMGGQNEGGLGATIVTFK